MKVIPYDTGKVKIGVHYEPKHNYHNSDQDWVQKILLGIETSWTTDTVLIGTIWGLTLYAVLGLLSGRN
jgi:F0F1-type ATP synthase assembly protein I